MPKINFTKIVASGNDFAVVETSNQKSFDKLRTLRRRTLSKVEVPVTRNLKILAKNICDRKFGIGADGLLILEKSKIADVKMRIFNPDGTEAKMCGNGAMCVALYSARNQTKIETKAGIIQAKVSQDKAKIKMTEPKDIRLDLPIKIAKRNIKVNFINIGVPHAVIFVEGLDKINVVDIGRKIRFHKRFLPEGTNVDFVQILDDNNIKIRTYERGVEDETLACGTGTVAAALLLAIRYSLLATHRVDVQTKSKETLKVYFDRVGVKFSNVWLEGKGKIVYKGEYYV